ncbi:uncharacterized protein LOC131382615 [Hylobates moloch]|uniref:uncharacterized protein LOC131382615 n=1 Tax=Hylobates moloch TaxID=81572 RepID=UPI002676C9B1|nr:uncharacterized protein LOC131382615 [Hylobates moloch]
MRMCTKKWRLSPLARPEARSPTLGHSGTRTSLPTPQSTPSQFGRGFTPGQVGTGRASLHAFVGWKQVGKSPRPRRLARLAPTPAEAGCDSIFLFFLLGKGGPAPPRSTATPALTPAARRRWAGLGGPAGRGSGRGRRGEGPGWSTRRCCRRHLRSRNRSRRRRHCLGRRPAARALARSGPAAMEDFIVISDDSGSESSGGARPGRSRRLRRALSRTPGALPSRTVDPMTGWN